MNLFELRNMVGRLMVGIDEAGEEDSGEASGSKVVKFTPKALRLMKDSAGIDSPEQEFYNFQRKILNRIEIADLLKLWNAESKTDVQDLIMHNPKKAMVLWTRNLRRVSPKIKKLSDDNPDSIPIYYYATMLKVTDRDTADILLRKHLAAQDQEEEGMEWPDGRGLTEQNASRGDLEDRVWKKKHKNYKMVIQRGVNKGKRAVVHLDKETGVATLSPLGSLSVAELMHMLGKK
jgi:hypothetical protein